MGCKLVQKIRGFKCVSHHHCPYVLLVPKELLEVDFGSYHGRDVISGYLTTVDEYEKDSDFAPLHKGTVTAIIRKTLKNGTL